MKRNLIISIFSILFLIFLIIYILNIRLLQQNEDTDIIGSENIIQNIEENNIKIEEIQDINKVLSLENVIRTYLKNVYIAEGEGETFPILKELDIEKGDNVFYIKEVYLLNINERNSLYFIKGNLINKKISQINQQYVTKQEIILTLTLDKENNTFEISKYGNKYKDYIIYKDSIINNSLKVEKLKQIKEEIQKNSLNIFNEKKYTDEEIAYRYFEDYRINALYFPEDSYKMIDEQYKKEKFSTFQSYKQYLQKYRAYIEESVLSKYSVYNTDEYIEYTLVDTYQNNYIIKIKLSPMNYTMYLDNYTIKSEKYETKYSNLDNNSKVANNASIFMFMINTGDYSKAYELLDNNFKNNNFKTLELFEKYVVSNFFEHNILTVKNVKQKANYYVCDIELRNNNSRASEKKDLEIIMILKEGTDFVMSFNIK